MWVSTTNDFCYQTIHLGKLLCNHKGINKKKMKFLAYVFNTRLILSIRIGGKIFLSAKSGSY